MATVPFSQQRKSFYCSTVENTRSRSSARISYSHTCSRWAEMGEFHSELRNSCGAGRRVPSHSPGPRVGRRARSEGPSSHRRGGSGRIGRDHTRQMEGHNEGPEGSQGNTLPLPSALPETSLAITLAPVETFVGAEETLPQIKYAE
uniref:Uncharacterized protein n=1 Tax=Sphaerodactylus townsendi TaxID=933632 RepID=A0ACB8F5J2_9SAUR